jgi:catechol 2,3-dioxygenase-like lactoylglutathione lyase family enzyme
MERRSRAMSAESEPRRNVRQAVPLLAVSRMEESLRFYVDGLGFEMTKKWIDEGKLRWCWLQIGGAGVMLQEIRTEGHDSWTPAGPLGEGVSICFLCEDALAFYREVTSRGIAVSRPFVGNGMWVASLRDPDGYRLEFESETDVPEDTQLSE